MAINRILNPLNWNVPIVGEGGLPTPEFIRKWTQQTQINALVPALSTPAEVSAVLDIIGALPGEVLVRGATVWSGLPSPSDATKFLNGAAAPAYAKVKDTDLALTDVTGNNVSITAHGFAPKAPNDGAKFLSGLGAYAQPKDSDLALTDITTNDVSITKHGFAPKAPNDATRYLDGTGAYSVPAGGGGGGGGTPTIRAHNMTPFTNTSSMVVNIPAGAVAGDTAVLFIGAAFNVTLVSDWANLGSNNISNWNYACYGKALKAADITAGNVTITLAGAAALGIAEMVVFVGAVRGNVVGQSFSASATTGAISTPFQTSSTNLICAFGSSRGNGAATMTPGTLLDSSTTASGGAALYTLTGVNALTPFAVAYAASNAHAEIVGAFST